MLNIRYIRKKRNSMSKNELSDLLFVPVGGAQECAPIQRKVSPEEDCYINFLKDRRTEFLSGLKEMKGNWTLKVLANTLDASNMLPAAITRFTEDVRGVEVVVFEEDEYPFLELDLDIGKDGFDISIGEHEGNEHLIQHRFVRDRSLKFYATSQYLEENGLLKNLEDVKEHSFLLPACREGIPQEVVLKGEIVSTSNNYSMLLGMAVDSFGIVLAPCDIVEEDPYLREQLIGILPDIEIQKQKIYMKNHRFLTVARQKLVDSFFESLKKEQEFSQPTLLNTEDINKYQYHLKRTDNSGGFKFEGKSELLNLTIFGSIRSFERQIGQGNECQITLTDVMIESEYSRQLWRSSKECRELVFYGFDCLMRFFLMVDFDFLSLKVPKEICKDLNEYETDLFTMALEEVLGFKITHDNSGDHIVIDFGDSSNLGSNLKKLVDFLWKMNEIYQADYEFSCSVNAFEMGSNWNNGDYNE